MFEFLFSVDTSNVCVWFRFRDMWFRFHLLNRLNETFEEITPTQTDYQTATSRPTTSRTHKTNLQSLDKMQEQCQTERICCLFHIIHNFNSKNQTRTKCICMVSFSILSDFYLDWLSRLASKSITVLDQDYVRKHTWGLRLELQYIQAVFTKSSHDHRDCLNNLQNLIHFFDVTTTDMFLSEHISTDSDIWSRVTS